MSRKELLSLSLSLFVLWYDWNIFLPVTGPLHMLLPLVRTALPNTLRADSHPFFRPHRYGLPRNHFPIPDPFLTELKSPPSDLHLRDYTNGACMIQ